MLELKVSILDLLDSIIPYCDCVRSVVSTLLTSDLLFNLFETDRSSLVSLKSDSLGCFDRLIVSNSWHSCCLSYKEFQILIKNLLPPSLSLILFPYLVSFLNSLTG